MESNKDFLEFHGLPKEIILSIIDRAQSLGTAWDDRTMPQILSGKRVALIADDSGWRNTTAFDLGVQAMGGIKCRPDAIFLPCPPVSREKEVTADAMHHPTCQSAAAKAYLLHAQNALLEWIVT